MRKEIHLANLLNLKDMHNKMVPKRPFQLQEKKLHKWGNLKKSKYPFTTVTSTPLVYNYIPSLTEMSNADGSLVRTGLSSTRQIEFLFIFGVYCCLVVQTSPRSPWMQRQTDCFHFPSFFPLCCPCLTVFRTYSIVSLILMRMLRNPAWAAFFQVLKCPAHQKEEKRE